MTDKDLRHASRKDLLVLLIEIEKENERLRIELEAAQKKLATRDLQMNDASSIAEASLQLNGIFEAAEASVQQYLENIRRCNEERDKILQDANQRAAEILTIAELEKTIRIKAADEYWNQLTDRMNTYLEMHQELKQLLSIPTNGSST